MNIKGVIFDLDGVLVDTIPLHFAAWKRLFEGHGYHFDEQVYREKVDGMPRTQGVLGVMSDLDETAAAKAGDLKQEYFTQMIKQQGLRPFASTQAFIDQLKKRGVRMAVASSSVNAPVILETIGILDYFATVVTADDVVQGKPHPEIFLTAANRIKLPASACVVIEDAQSGIEAAKRGGFFCIGVNRDSSLKLDLPAAQVVTDLAEIDVDVLERQFSASRQAT